MSAAAPAGFTDYKVANISQAGFGRKEIAIAETEMPGLMAIRDEYRGQQPLKGAKILGCIHMTIQTAVLIETLTALGAKVRWASCNIFSTQDHAAAAVAAKGVPVFAVKGETLEEYWEYTHRIFEWTDGGYSNMILDDGGDATLLLHLGAKAEKDQSVLHHPSSEEERVLFAAISAKLKEDATWYSTRLEKIQGVTEETTTGIHKIREAIEAGEFKMRAINVNDSVTKSKFDNLYGCRESLVDGIKRATDVMVAGKVAVVAGYGDVGKGSAQALRALSAQVWVTEVDPICALQAAMDGFEVKKMENAVKEADIIVTASGCRDLITEKHFRAMKDKAIVCNIGHFDIEIDVAWLEKNAKKNPEIRHRTDEYLLSNGKRILLIAEGRLVNLGAAEGHPAVVMDMSFADQALAAEWLTKVGKSLAPGVHNVPTEIDKEVARLKLKSMGAKIDDLSEIQENYLNSWEHGS